MEADRQSVNSMKPLLPTNKFLTISKVAGGGVLLQTDFLTVRKSARKFLLLLCHQICKPAGGGGVILQTDFLTVRKSARKFLLLLCHQICKPGGYFCRQISWLLGNLLGIFYYYSVTKSANWGRGNFCRQISWLLGNLPENFYYYPVTKSANLGGSEDRYTYC